MAATSIPQQPDAPAYGAVAITPSDTVDLTKPCRALYIGSAGDLKVIMQDDTTVTFASVAVGIWPFAVKRIYATLTTASSIIGLY